MNLTGRGPPMNVLPVSKFIFSQGESSKRLEQPSMKSGSVV